ncbi:hypothetical protein DBV15_05079 [Temnothorax longispinosus]|uniref:Uncharacterized protein n=1 Tax=Temnothorax longispinosus TaxID=300112 RepID=A0A4S2KYP4_9HYME|nr:hypothetical protein DBV15_05079 [Temnothorax longispinosus]
MFTPRRCGNMFLGRKRLRLRRVSPYPLPPPSLSPLVYLKLDNSVLGYFSPAPGTGERREVDEILPPLLPPKGRGSRALLWKSVGERRVDPRDGYLASLSLRSPAYREGHEDRGIQSVVESRQAGRSPE